MPPTSRLSSAVIAALLNNKRKESPPDQSWTEDPVRPSDSFPAARPPEPDFTPLEDILGERRTPGFAQGFAKPEPQWTLPTIGGASSMGSSPEPQFTPLGEILGERPTPVSLPAPAKPEPQLNLPTIGDVWQRMQAENQRTAAYSPSGDWEPERDVIFPPLPGYSLRYGLLGRVIAGANGASMPNIGFNPEQSIGFDPMRPTPTPFGGRPGTAPAWLWMTARRRRQCRGRSTRSSARIMRIFVS